MIKFFNIFILLFNLLLLCLVAYFIHTRGVVYVLHRDKIGDGIVDDALYRSERGGAIERQANNYGASILMPAPLVGEKWRAGATTAASLARAFQVSPAVAAIRIEELRLS